MSAALQRPAAGTGHARDQQVEAATAMLRESAANTALAQRHPSEIAHGGPVLNSAVHRAVGNES